MLSFSSKVDWPTCEGLAGAGFAGGGGGVCAGGGACGGSCAYPGKHNSTLPAKATIVFTKSPFLAHWYRLYRPQAWAEKSAPPTSISCGSAYFQARATLQRTAP